MKLFRNNRSQAVRIPNCALAQQKAVRRVFCPVSRPLLDALDVFPFDDPADAEYANIRLELEASGQPIGPNDLPIAARARGLGTTIVTANAAEFGRVRGRDVENSLD